MLNFKGLLITRLATGLVLIAVGSANAADVVNVESDGDAQSYSTQETTDAKVLKERNENIDVARELTITKSSSNAYYKLPLHICLF